MNDSLSYFYLQIKVQGLLYLLLQKLSAREDTEYPSISSADAERLLTMSNEIISDLSTPPVLRNCRNLRR